MADGLDAISAITPVASSLPSREPDLVLSGTVKSQWRPRDTKTAHARRPGSYRQAGPDVDLDPWGRSRARATTKVRAVVPTKIAKLAKLTREPNTHGTTVSVLVVSSHPLLP